MRTPSGRVERDRRGGHRGWKSLRALALRARARNLRDYSCSLRNSSCRTALFNMFQVSFLGKYLIFTEEFLFNFYLIFLLYLFVYFFVHQKSIVRLKIEEEEDDRSVEWSFLFFLSFLSLSSSRALSLYLRVERCIIIARDCTLARVWECDFYCGTTQW